MLSSCSATLTLGLLQVCSSAGIRELNRCHGLRGETMPSDRYLTAGDAASVIP
jgi:hypothetical protein